MKLIYGWGKELKSFVGRDEFLLNKVNIIVAKPKLYI